MDQEQPAERAGLTPKYICRIERAEVSPSLRVLQQLAGAFELRLDRLFRVPER
jgi:transcriptional regulator with XRE-family HTH domain